MTLRVDVLVHSSPKLEGENWVGHNKYWWAVLYCVWHRQEKKGCRFPRTCLSRIKFGMKLRIGWVRRWIEERDASIIMPTRDYGYRVNQGPKPLWYEDFTSVKISHTGPSGMFISTTTTMAVRDYCLDLVSTKDIQKPSPDWSPAVSLTSVTLATRNRGLWKLYLCKLGHFYLDDSCWQWTWHTVSIKRAQVDHPESP